ncbi:Casein kinase I [Tritrichomonas foetus]|uniref:non-specific serine/threonine protein kinase n=1 Tax=Tritrichomonas foetus TaxID=1144522 RepID=A0A1J4KI37_9EUKA|nr:Casein kinase I [Tritrichomonas foetus]|eukprot:OHT11047.1 Casein kinase I [Tritrichomonas foetus]
MNDVKFKFSTFSKSYQFKKRMEKIIDGRFLLKAKIGQGSFGEVFIAEDLKTHENIAIKIESPKIRLPQLSMESKIYTIFNGAINIPHFIWYGSYGQSNAMAFELCGKSLKNLFLLCRRRLSLKTVLMLADQMLTTIEYVHTRHFIHRDLKPDNFVMGLGKKSNQLYLIDFGLSRKYRDPQNLEHVPFCTNKLLTGTARYASINALKGYEQSRRDDMEALGYVWIYLMRGSLPWMGITAKETKQKYDKILSMKKHTPIEDLCLGFPEEFVQYFNLVRQLKYTDEPDYAGYRKLFRDLFSSLNYEYDYKYDWCNIVVKKANSVINRSYHGIDVKQLCANRNNYNLKNNFHNNLSNNLDNDMNCFTKGNENVTKRTPIIHNIRLVPNYNTGRKSTVNLQAGLKTNPSGTQRKMPRIPKKIICVQK